MKNKANQQPKFKIELPRLGDEFALASMHIQAWKESYVTAESGLTESMVDEMMGYILTDTRIRTNSITESLTNPNKVLYRVVKNDKGSIVGFLHCSKNEKFNEIEAIYLLNEVKGSGIGGKLMREFLDWADKSKPCHLAVFSFNDKALGFYSKYGFVKIDKPLQFHEGKIPFVEMIRPVEDILKV